jgi:hypothetical protein
MAARWRVQAAKPPLLGWAVLFSAWPAFPLPMVTAVVTRWLEVASDWEDLNQELPSGGQIRRPAGTKGCRAAAPSLIRL